MDTKPTNDDIYLNDFVSESDKMEDVEMPNVDIDDDAMDNGIVVIKKDGNEQQWESKKITDAIEKSAYRANVILTDDEKEEVVKIVYKSVINTGSKKIKVSMLHGFVETALSCISEPVAESYRNYRNYKNDFDFAATVYAEANRITYIGDKENSNSDSTLVSTKRSLEANVLSKELYKKFFLPKNVIQAVKDGYIYIHDMNARRHTMNCCLFNVKNVLSGGFEMSNMWYNEPKRILTAFSVIGDMTIMSAAQQYGGFTLPQIDEVLAPYAEKSYNIYKNKYLDMGIDETDADKYAKKDTIRDIESGYQGWEYKFNTVASCRGDYPFITITLGLATDYWGKEIAKAILRVHAQGQGAEGKKRHTLFPKIVFLYDKNLHSEPGAICSDVFEEGLKCSETCMYPDWLSLTGEGYVASMYKKYGKQAVVSPMGCVDGKEIITYKFHHILYVESFERMWNRITKEIKDRGQNGTNDVHRVVDLTGSDVFIYDTVKGFIKVKYLIRNLQNNWCDVSISNGRKLRTTLDHPFETDRGMVFAKDLTTDDTVIINQKQYSEENFDVPTDLAWLQGFMLCDGCYQNYSVFASIASKGEDDIEDAFKTAVNNHFGVTPVTVSQERGKKGSYKDMRIYSDGSSLIKDLISYFTDLYGGVQKEFRHVPPEVFSYKNDAKYAFLAGMIDADGSINDDTKKHKFPTVQIGSTNKELALQQLALAQSLGMPAKLYINHYDSNDKTKIRYRVEFFPNSQLLDAMKCKKKTSKCPNGYQYDECDDLVYGRIMDVEPLDIEQYSYDVTTESEHFEVSGIYSHNCRAFLSPWYERGGIKPADENDKPVFIGRFNIGAISLHLPMILQKSRVEKKDFYEVLDYYMDMIRDLHRQTYSYLSKMKASSNPLGYCEGGFYGGHLNYNDRIEPVLKSSTASFGITALEELQHLYNGKSLFEDGEFAIEVMKHINERVEQYKQEDNYLYAIYGTPAENLCGLQIKQFRKKYGIIPGVSDKEYVSNSFHCHVTSDITPIEKQDAENRFWNLCNGGKIQYVKYPIAYNHEAVKTLVLRAMDMGLYEGVNLALSYCDDCGHQELNMDKQCPVCGSKNITKIDRMNGYLSYSRVKGDTRLNDAKMAEIADRKSM